MLKNPGTLVIGGARSGKSRFAEHLIVSSGLPRTYIATSTPFDDEMTARIAKHRRERGRWWATIEEPLDIASVIFRETGPEKAVLVDCLTLWLNNLIFYEKDIAAETLRLCELVKDLRGPCVFVSNEVGLGIVPENRLSRSFRDAQGRLNQDIGEACGKVVFVAAGQPMLLKPRQEPEITL
ncbi:adenosylcobinamide kinase /adenosylcobinamide-phosphate guanylyltransferase [Roseibium hamelinense]|uniref:Bifunctional adenosylcobalamin biosynthesis protein n=1 Tax=Roseibium hamelinense TaxID=150831 RepID=A0A562TGT3_9HYPH|nr:bifunctional adenosylcobinamide kinase/adenosylcobinamide-phosphate guanylyltransferase [Roseibium hamelinense]MTI46047.1 bifunctional adenosylcobinamide kinase/adenosylcobinamide-phosphate guanylyltransferase [Roseibium hamelinense]TWI92762.1 adenosylcobinamide kinase /adenosylcobinamide-phosphate guanylyltransferase [Roseibium hamelinense]